MKIKNITVGIPAFNEERNISQLIHSVIKQKLIGIRISEIVVSSDGSSDNTVYILKKMKNKILKIYENSDRMGIARGLNQIIENTSSDILVTLDADITIKDENFIQNLVDPIIKEDVDHTSSAILDIENTTYFSRIISNSMKLKEILFGIIRDGHNVYNCRGLARGYSKRFYKEIRFPSSIGNDAYSYLLSAKKGYSFKYVKKAIAYYKLPSNLSDHLRQSSRFFSTGLVIGKHFNKDFVKNELKISFFDYLKAFLISIPILLKNPLKSLIYYVIQFFVSFKVLGIYENKQTWDLAYSTK